MVLTRLLAYTLIACVACRQSPNSAPGELTENDTPTAVATDDTKIVAEDLHSPRSNKIETGNTNAEQLVAYAKTHIGTPYLYASTDPQKGFDCSGFITYVFNHFNITVPRSSIGFTHVQRQVSLDSARLGDLILFTGTDSTTPEVGHMGIIVSANGTREFIHSTSGKAYGVTITPVNDYYLSRFVKVIRMFE